MLNTIERRREGSARDVLAPVLIAPVAGIPPIAAISFLRDEKSDDITTSECHARGMEGASIRPARLEELPFPDELVLRSKSHWAGGHVEDVPAMTPKLTATDIAARHATVADKDGVPIGFTHSTNTRTTWKIGLLFVDRPFIGTGVGRLLWGHLVQQAVALGARRLGVGAEPRAEGFCQRMGMVSQEEFDHNGERLIWMMSEIGKVVT